MGVCVCGEFCLVCGSVCVCCASSLSTSPSPFCLSIYKRHFKSPHCVLLRNINHHSGMHGYENNYNVMGWYLNNWNGQITAEQSKTNVGRYYTNHFAIAVSGYYKMLFHVILYYLTSGSFAMLCLSYFISHYFLHFLDCLYLINVDYFI